MQSYLDYLIASCRGFSWYTVARSCEVTQEVRSHCTAYEGPPLASHREAYDVQDTLALRYSMLSHLHIYVIRFL